LKCRHCQRHTCTNKLCTMYFLEKLPAAH